MKQFKNGYKELFEASNIPNGYRLNNQRTYFGELSHFVGMKGKKYDEQDVRLLIVGRAVNGWGQFNISSADSFSEEAFKKFENDRFDWIVCDGSFLRNDYCEDGEYYWLKNSPFWRTNRNVWRALSGKFDFIDVEDDRWVDYIAWTNLYKIAPKKTGNPTTTMSKKQLTACKKILKAEIEKFNPTHILFVTGYKWWFEDFKDILGVEFRDVRKNEYYGEKKNLFFAEAKAKTENGIKIVVSCRPEFRDEEQYVIDVLNSFISLDAPEKKPRVIDIGLSGNQHVYDED